MAIEQDDWRLVFMPESDILKASGVCAVLKNRWFAVHPEKGLIFWQPIGTRKGQLHGASPQCNLDRQVGEIVILKQYPWAELKRFDMVFQPTNPSDY